MENYDSEEEFIAKEVYHIKSDSDGFSDSEDELEYYDPVPYAFCLKDARKRSILIPSNKLYKAKIISPSFSTLLDHTVAVLWCFYSREGHSKLGTSQLHWAIKFLEGLHDERSNYTTDVSMAIDDLEEALMSISINLKEEDIENRKYDKSVESLREFPPCFPHGYNDLLYDYRKNDNGDGTHLDKSEEYKSQNSANTSINKESPSVNKESALVNKGYPLVNRELPSIIINDILESNRDAQSELMIMIAKNDARAVYSDVYYDVPVCQKSCTAFHDSIVCPKNYACQNSHVNQKTGVCQKNASIAGDICATRNRVIENAIKLLEEMKNMQQTLNERECSVPNQSNGKKLENNSV